MIQKSDEDGNPLLSVHAVNIVGSVQVEYRTRKVFAGFAVNFVNTYFGLFTVIVKF